MNNEKIIVKMFFGSTLYGTRNENSDTDIKGVFLPRRRDIILGRIPQQYSEKRNKVDGEKNTKEDIDIEIFSLHEFIKLACEGQTLALDMLHAPGNMIIEGSRIWSDIVAHRDKFYTKNLKAFIGYAQRQAAKYGIRESRLNTASDFIKILELSNQNVQLSEIWDILKDLDSLEHFHFLGKDENGIEKLQVCGKQFHETARVNYVLPIIKRFYDNYGERAKLAADNQGIDFKAVSHAIRVSIELKELLTEGTIIFPLKEAEMIRKVKDGKMDYITEVVPILEGLMDEVTDLSEKSKLPDKVDRKFWDDFIIDVIENYVLSEYL